MSKPYLVILGTAFSPSAKLTTAFGEKRTRQYVMGLERVGELAEKYPDFDFIIVDNTIALGWQMPKEIEMAINKIPNIRHIFFNANELAAQNKGCGVIAGWKKVLETIDLSGYKYCLYFEPRQLLLDFNFFQRFLKNPGNYFKILTYRVTAKTKPWLVRLLLRVIPIFRRQFEVGLFSLETKLFSEYARGTSLPYLADKGVSMEDDMYKKLKNKHIKRVKNLGILWHNSFNNTYVIF